MFEVMLGEDSYHVHICAGTRPPPVETKTKLSKNLSFNNILRILGPML